jgi:hypothetical protein
MGAVSPRTPPKPPGQIYCQQTPPGRSHNQKRLRANTQREATAQRYSTSFHDINKSAEENDESDLTELDIEEGEDHEEYKDVDEKEEEEEEEDDVEE